MAPADRINDAVKHVFRKWNGAIYHWPTELSASGQNEFC
jgi:hypothetical protein